MNSKAIKQIFNRTGTQIAIIILLVFLSYFNILQNGISYDDQDFLLNWPQIRDSQSGLSALLNLPDLLAGEVPSLHKGIYRPIRSVYYLVSMQLWGFNTFAFHLQAIIVHLLITITVYFITKLLTKRTVVSFITAAFFAAHPIHTEAVSYTAASFDTLGILFFFASFYFYLKAESSKDQQNITRLLSWLLAFLAFFTYEMTLALPLLIIAYEFCFKKLTLKTLSRRLSIYIPYLLILLGYLFVRFYLLNIGSRGDVLGTAYLPASNQAKIGTPEIIFNYIYLLIFPLNLTVSYPVPSHLFLAFYRSVLAFDPTGNLLNSISNYIIFFPIFFVGTLLATSVFVLKKYKLINFAIFWFLISLLPILNILPHGSVIAERYLYIPSFAFCLILALGLYQLSTLKIKKTVSTFRLVTVSLIIFLILSAYVSRTYLRNLDWKDQESIFLSALRVEPTDFMASSALASIKIVNKDYQAALIYAKQAIETNPVDSNAHYQLGLAYEKTGDTENAIRHYKKSLEVENNFYFSNIALGNIYKTQGKYREAVAEYEKAIRAYPESFESYFNRAGVYVHMKKYDLAIKDYETALKIKPSSAVIHNNLGYIAEQQNDSHKAILEYSRAIQSDPENVNFRLNLAFAYEKNGDYERSLIEFQKAEPIKPDDKEIKKKIEELKTKDY